MPIRRSTRVIALVALAVVGTVLASPASAYAVICRHGQFAIDSRDDAQLRIAFGTSFCTFRRFNFRSDAETFARNNNMQPGRSCSCR